METTYAHPRAIASTLPDPRPGLVLHMTVDVMLAYMALHGLDVVQIAGGTCKVRMPAKAAPDEITEQADGS